MTNKFPIGSQWKTRAGHRAVVVEHFDNGDILVYQAFDGTLSNRDMEGMGGDGDLLTPWTEPREGTFWVNVYDGNNLQLRTVHESKEKADDEAGERVKNDRLACVRCDWTEGDGL